MSTAALAFVQCVLADLRRLGIGGNDAPVNGAAAVAYLSTLRDTADAFLAALRYWQRNDAAQRPDLCAATDLGAFPPLGDEEIDMLCEQITLQHEANARRSADA
jgi:hypothetical protein